VLHQRLRHMLNEWPPVIAPARLCRMQSRDKLPAIIVRVRRQFVSRIMKWIRRYRSAYLSINYDLINTVLTFCTVSCRAQCKHSVVLSPHRLIGEKKCLIRNRNLVHETDFYLPVSHASVGCTFVSLFVQKKRKTIDWSEKVM